MVKFKPCDRLIIKYNVEEKLINYYHKGAHLNKEVCGILTGLMGVVDNIIEIPNTSENPNLYVFDPIAFNKELNQLDKDNKELLAIFHTHGPNSLELSQIDLETAKLNVVHIVVSSVMDGDNTLPKVDYKGWNIRNQVPTEVQLIASGKRSQTSEKASGIEIKISANGLEAIVNMVDTYIGGPRLRRENSRLESRISELERERRSGDSPSRPRIDHSDLVIGRRRGRPITRRVFDGSEDPAGELFSSAEDPGDIAEDELALDELEGAPSYRQSSHSSIPKVEKHVHQYQWLSKTPDDTNLYECTFPNCNAKLTVHGNIVAGVPTKIDPPEPFVPMLPRTPKYCWGCGEKFEPDARILDGYCVTCIKDRETYEKEQRIRINNCHSCGAELPETVMRFERPGQQNPKPIKCEKCRVALNEEENNDGKSKDIDKETRKIEKKLGGKEDD